MSYQRMELALKKDEEKMEVVPKKDEKKSRIIQEITVSGNVDKLEAPIACANNVPRDISADKFGKMLENMRKTLSQGVTSTVTFSGNANTIDLGIGNIDFSKFNDDDEKLGEESSFKFK